MPNDTTSHDSIIGVGYSFRDREIHFHFDSHDKAKAYQRKNYEARIPKDHPKHVQIPVADGIKYLRDSDHGLVFGFSTIDQAKAWGQHILLASEYSGKEVHIRRKWKHGSLDELLAW
ncbi:hypothetical protein BDV96DRAFT_603137 [Lophiotrema nucula]|uniref:Uncharacterized protein n=1 Tax=Lophiotrema nucula TaxID=690887 RepID=A0A6A5YZK5_9PLEO|nr:hypothetical protein BDV96DRAFT_603137 [Lophiotrema nucula]